MRGGITCRAADAAVGLFVLTAGAAYAGTPLPATFPAPPTTEATLTAQQAAIGGAYIAPGRYSTRAAVPTFPVPAYPDDTQSPGEDPDPKNERTPLVREWEIMGPSDDGSGLLAGSRDSLRRRLGRFCIFAALLGGGGFFVFRRAQKHLDATLRGWGLPVD